jgi:hypothetical protein|tara:strand:- start:1331 stop:1522 length:192 start_codon:yes stop_codon:yes gene_type:complete
MRNEYDFSKARKNLYASMLKKPITVRLDEDSISYFKSVSEEIASLIKILSTYIYEIAPLPIKN